MTPLLLALALAGATPDTSDPYEGLYACTVNGDHHVVWIGTVGSGTRASTQWARYSVFSPDDYPFSEQIRPRLGSTYHTRDGGFNSGNSGVDFEGDTFLLDDAPCGEVETLRDVLTTFGLDPDGVTQEVMDREGWAPDQVAARLDDAAFASAAFSPEANFGSNGRPTFARVLLGETLPEPPPPPNAAPADVPEAADAYEGIYSDGRMLYVVRDGRFVQFTHESDSDWDQGFQYVFAPRAYYPRAYDYRVVDGAFASGDSSEMEFLRRDGQVAAMVWRGQELARVYTVRQMYQASHLQLEHLVNQIREDHGLSDAEIDAALDDAARFREVVREGNAPITLGMLLGLE